MKKQLITSRCILGAEKENYREKKKKVKIHKLMKITKVSDLDVTFSRTTAITYSNP